MKTSGTKSEKTPLRKNEKSPKYNYNMSLDNSRVKNILE